MRSSAIRAVGYDGKRRVLAVEFLNGGQYEYLNVPKRVYTGMLAAQPHPWSVYGREIRAFRYRKVN